MYQQDDIPRYRKRSKKRGGKKANHKHIYTSCVLERDAPVFDNAHGLVENGRTLFSIGSYCPVCGKIESFIKDEWRCRRYVSPLIYGRDWNEAAEREFNPETRTLPYFRVHDLFQKYVTLPEEAQQAQEGSSYDKE